MGYTNPSFPNSIWNGITDADGNTVNRNRQDRSFDVAPNSDDWDQIVAEIIAVQTTIAAQGSVEANALFVTQAITDADLDAGDAVRLKSTGNLEIADQSTSGGVIGFSTDTYLTTETATIVTFGLVTKIGWGLTPGDTYFLSTSGAITSTAPSSGFSVRVGEALTSAILNFHAQAPITL